jgi:hypothetical protein
MSGHVPFEDHVSGVVAAAGFGFCVVVLIVDLCGEVCVIGLDGRSGAIFCLWMFLFDGVGITDAADYLFVLVLKLLDALLELLELLGKIDSLLHPPHGHQLAISARMLLF